VDSGGRGDPAQAGDQAAWAASQSRAEALGRQPPASRYSADMSKHAYLGTDPTLKTEYQDYAQRL